MKARLEVYNGVLTITGPDSGHLFVLPTPKWDLTATQLSNIINAMQDVVNQLKRRGE